MTLDNSEPFHCSHCENSGEISFSHFQSQHQKDSAKIMVKNLPKGITALGVKNLFLTVGKPQNITFNAENKTAVVFLDSIKQAELAVRDLHCKPPYDLRVKILTSGVENTTEKQDDKVSTSDEPWDFSHQEKFFKIKISDNIKETKDVVKQIRSAIKNLGYDPSIRMRQKKLDFKTDSECVFRGRGYLYMGAHDRFIGGLQHFETTSENSTAKDKIRFSCEICKALTTKICGKCSVPFCSKVCLSSSNVDHCSNCSDIRCDKVQQSTEFGRLNSSFDQRNSSTFSLQLSSQVPLTEGCTLVISTYFTMNTVFVRRADQVWEEKFTKLCNDVAIEAFKGENLEETPKEGEFVIARYLEDLCFYRAKVCSGDKQKVKLFFIDFGNTQETELEHIKPLPDHLKSVPPLAVEVHLKDVPEGSSLESVNYFNKLTAEKTALILKLENSTKEVILIEKDSKVNVNETVMKYALPSWKKNDFDFSKQGEVFYLTSVGRQNFEIGKTFNLVISHFDVKEFLESEVFWVTNPEIDEFHHVNAEMYPRVEEYCALLKDDCYLPRVNELCLAKENGKWHRCVNLKSCKTTCCLFFIDDGHSSLVETQNIRQMIQDFTETPSQAVCCTLPDNPRLKTNQELQSKVAQYLKESHGQKIYNVSVLKLMGDAYCLSIPEINKILT